MLNRNEEKWLWAMVIAGSFFMFFAVLAEGFASMPVTTSVIYALVAFGVGYGFRKTIYWRSPRWTSVLAGVLWPIFWPFLADELVDRYIL